ncbi:serine/threonine-protein kinase SMG1-like isoform X2 [Argiope bruennichi]|uniref:serine/threonine-protein kinase SMG1-like isoform X2 n=1 Tax=Argiope bruennichi TaxID=94029 RepID=UPI002493FBE5|nr:serine/threonine-protein kinase SMG1-like isoform X2 [Argiope bruennichi]
MNQRSTFSRTKEPRREKIIRTRRDDDERFQDEPPTRRNSSERPNTSHASSYTRFKDNFSDKPRSNSRDTQGSLVFRRQERGKLQTNFSKGSTGEVSPGRVSHTDSMRNESSGRSNYISHYNRGINSRERDYNTKRSGYLDNSHIVDETRLKNILHRLLRDEDKERQASLIRQLRSIFEHPENFKIIQTNKDDIFSTFEDFIQLGLNTELKHEFVLTVGSLGAVLGFKAKGLLEWEFNVVSLSKSEEVRILILKSLLEMLKIDGEKKNISELVPMIMSKLQSTLEVADAPDMLIAIVNVITEIANKYPEVFSKHFSDTVDILIGWHIDATQQQSVIEFTSNTLIGFQHFWISDINFTITLLGQFLEDMESYAEELAQSKLNSTGNTEKPNSAEENVRKIKSLIRVLITVLKSIGDLITIEENGPITPMFVTEMLKNFLKCVKITVGYCFSSDLITSANECLVLLLRFNHSHSKNALNELMVYIEMLQSKNNDFVYESHVVSILCVMISFVKAVGTYLPVEFVTLMFSPTSVVRELRLSPSEKIQKLLMELYHVVLAVKKVQTMEECYKCILSDITEAHNEILKSCSETPQNIINLKVHEVTLLLSICGLVEIGNIKHSLIGIFALKPSFFDLMINHLKPTEPELAKNFPGLQASILYTLYSHCQRHSHYVNNSALLNPKSSTAGSSMSASGHSSPIMTDVPPPSPSSGNLEKIIHLLIDLLEGQYNSYDSKLLAAMWTTEILEQIQPHLPRLLQNPSFNGLLQATLNSGFSHYSSICKYCCKSLYIFLKWAVSALSDSVLQRYYDLCILRLNSHEAEVQDEFVSLLSLLPLDVILKGPTVNLSKGGYLQPSAKDHESSYKPLSILDIWTVFRGYMGRSSSGNFFGHHFRSITNFILQGKAPQEKNWLLRLYISCPPPERRSRVDSLLSQLSSISSAVLWFWAVWEVAQFCVVNKLRTPLGKPQETFMAIEGALKSAAKPSKNQEGSYSESKQVTLLRYNLLLSLMEHLEKHMYNAYEGCAAALPSPPKNVRTFFRTNKSTCHEWLARVRSTAVVVALNAGCPAAAVRHGFELLKELKNNGNTMNADIESTLYGIVKALILLHSPEAILGLYIWCKENFNRKFTWIKASVDCAAGRLENAVNEYLCILQSLSHSMSPEKKAKPTDDLNKANDKLKNSINEQEALVTKVNGNDIGSNKHQIDVHLHSFLINQVIDCYVKLQSWPEAVKWSEFLENVKFHQNGLSIQGSSSSNNLAYLRCLSSFEESSTAFSKKDATTLVNNLTNSESQTNSLWTMEEQFSKVQKTIMCVAINAEAKSRSSEFLRDMSEQINEAKGDVLKLMKIPTLNWPPQIDASQASLFLSASTFQFNKISSALLRENVKFDPSDCYSSVLGFLLNWENIWLRMNQSSPSGKLQGSFFDLLMVTARLARKQQNFNMCHKLIFKALNHLCKHSPNYESRELNFPNNYDICNLDSLKSMMAKTANWNLSEKLIKIQRESAKLLHCAGEYESSCDLLLKSICVLSCHLMQLKCSNISEEPIDQLSELNSRSMLNLVKYIHHDTRLNSQDNSELCAFKETAWYSLLKNTIKDLKPLNSASLCKHFEKGLPHEKVVNEPDYLVGQLLELSVYQCPNLAKSWCNFASWCYGHGRKVVNTACNGSLHILPEEKERILSLIPNVHKEDFDALLGIITSLHNASGSEWDNQEMDYTESGVEEIRWQLMAHCPFLLKLENQETIIESIIDVWKGLVSRAYSYYRIAAVSYLQYLKLNGKAVNKEKTEDDNVTATLRLLRLVVKHASELRDVLEDGLAETPTAPWRGIIPQLFSRLNHPEMYVRQSISDLLCRVAQAAPHLIVFPAVVGSLTLKVGPQFREEASGLFGAYFSDAVEDAAESQVENSQVSAADELPHPISSLSDDDSEDDRQKTAIMQNCFTALVETLGSQDERTISEAKNLIHELHRITLLWDELWLGTMNMHQSEVNRRFLNLEKEISKVMSNQFLSKEEKREIIKEKHNVYVKPTLYLLEQLQTITSQPAETPHEQWFQKTFEKPIENAMNKLKNPEDPSRPQESWAVFKQLYQLLQQKVQQQSRSHLNMEQISPILASLKSTVIPMPGINKASGVVTVQSVHSTVSILPTKTKPKKLAFIGSDGHRYTYLFKGLEDLHLDERIMQFLSIVNNMFAKNKRHGKQVYYARHYSVTPLGPRSGLIQWVDGATPLFGLYKRWQQREASASGTKGQNSNGNVATILRPSEIFYNKLTPLLKEKNINSLDNRKEWPLSVLLEVLKQLMNETADDLLAKELWCSCSSAQEWWNVTLTYNYSTAVMSIIGYIIGLGDRHLDNVLVDLSTGEVVHIDYNVCFEKGKNLRVPEKVPFRMTPNIKTALGLTGVEGVFRTSCEHVLKVLRKGRETLLTLLEAFVYDPLVDWTPGSEGGYTGAVYGGRQAWAAEAKQTRQGMELDIALSMFAIRVAEMKGEWLKNRDDLLSAFPKLENLLQEWKTAQSGLQIAETELQEACQEKALLEEALANPNHNLYSVPARYDETTIVKTTVNATKEAVVEKLGECKKWHALHCEALSNVSGSELNKKYGDVSNDQNYDTLSVAPVVEFLQSAGQGQLVQQCEHAESELANTLQQRRLTMRNCIDLLTTYATVILQFGPSYKEQNRCFKWQQWLESLLADFSSLKCIEIIADFRNQYGRDSTDAIQSAISLNVEFQSLLNDANKKVLTFMERIRMERVEDKNALATFAEETKCAVLHYLTESGESCHLAFLCVLGEALCTIRKQLFMMENAAGASGDRLVDLTSWNGDWFLDEISSTCANVAQYVLLLLDSSVIKSNELKSALQGVKLAHIVFLALEDLNLHFQNIILPEAIQTALEPSVIEMVAKLDRIIARCGIPLEKLIADLQCNITNLILETQITENRAADTVKKLRNEFESLMQRSEPQITGLNQGQMLLMGFNGLFTKVDSDLEALLTFLDNLLVPASWQKLDFYADTISLAPSIHYLGARPILKDIYFVKKLSAMQQAFHVCHSFAASLQINSRPGILEREIHLIRDQQLVQPVKQFIADYVCHMVLGLPSQAIGFAVCMLVNHLGYDLSSEIELRDIGVENKAPTEEILLKACKWCISKHFSEDHLPALSTLLGAFDAAWRKEDLARRLEQYLVVARGGQQRAQLHLARFQWLNEDLLMQGNIGALQSPSVSSRATVMSEIRKTVNTLVTFDCVVSSAQERYLSLTSGIEQRLKWAAGANPSLSTVQEEFEAAIAAKTAMISSANQISRELVNVCNSVLHFEALRTKTTEALSSDNTFIALITRCKETCELAESCQSQISPIEEHLISLQPLEKDGVTTDWLTSIIKKVSQSLSSCREKLEQQKTATNTCWEALHLQVAHVHDLISVHHKLMSEVRHILRNLAKHEEQELGIDYKADGHIHRYMAMYKEFSERISAIVSKLLAEAQDMDANSVATVEAEIPVLSVSALEIYNQLLDLAGPLGNRKHGLTEAESSKLNNKKNLLSPLYEPALALSPAVRPKTPRGGTPKKMAIARDPRTGKAVQERNTYATNVWKRIKMKLDGKDPDPSKKASISEQVDFVIKEATHLENLAVLYEGWTPWV